VVGGCRGGGRGVTASPTAEPIAGLRLKRVADVAVAALILPVALPLAAVVVTAMAIDAAVAPPDRGGLIYRERRVSRGREFDLLKLRTLHADALRTLDGPDAHARILEADSANLTWAGRRVLKPWYLDELPQLVNVLRGEMSLVGPRPWPPSMVARQVDRGVDYRLKVRAGWTGPAQVSKGQDVKFEDLDVAYVERCERSSGLELLRYDLGILWQTARTLLRGEGLRF
jgi:lipopolysaccharide/colanic/teichoic acid biosynthesis glycosyltransferase